MTDRLPDGLRERFGLDPAQFERLGDTTRHATFRQDDLAIRFEEIPAAIWPDGSHADAAIGWQHRLIEFFAKRIPEVHAPLAVEAGVSVWAYVKGQPARRNYEPHAVAAAELLGRLHRAGVDWNGGPCPGARTTPGEGTRGPIHGDFHRQNLLVCRGRIVSVIDWEESCVDLLQYELANAVWEFCKSKRTNDFDRRLAQEMIEAYGSDLSPDELVPLILARRRIELAATDDPSYREHTRRAIANLS